MSWKSKWQASRFLAAGHDVSAEREAVIGALEDLTACAEGELKKHEIGEMNLSEKSFFIQSLGHTWKKVSHPQNRQLIEDSIKSLEAHCKDNGVSINASLGIDFDSNVECIKLKMPSN
ncbi:MAG TPA: hypothetical protein VIF12_07515 [Micavibrio sp.]|jgi:predicted metal-dependent hydrolase